MDPWTLEGHRALGRVGLDEVRRLETLASRAWPPLEAAPLGGWVLRAAAGVSRRANSAWPRQTHTLRTDQLLRATTTWYEARGLPPRIQLSPAVAPDDLAHHLAGWAVDGHTLVLTGDVAGVGDADGVRLDRVADETWLATAVAAGAVPDDVGVVRTVLGRITGTAGFATAYREGVPVAVARAVVDRDDVGVLSVGTLPDHRGRGHARRAMAALAAWAADEGGRRTWLQVAASNEAALRLYAGMTPAFSYAYATRT